MRAISPSKIGGLAPGASVKLERHPQGRGEDRHADARRTAARAAAGARRAATSARRRQREVPRLGLSLAPANSVAGAGSEGVVVTEVDPERPRRRAQGFTHGDVILEVGGKTVVEPGRCAQGARDARIGRQAHRADAREVRRERPRSSRCRSDAADPRPLEKNARDGAVPPAIVAPAGGATRGTGSSNASVPDTSRCPTSAPAFPVPPDRAGIA